MQEKIRDVNGNEISFVTQITLENGNVYTLYSDGKLYEEIEGKGFVEIDRLNDANKTIISEIMKRLKPARTDITDVDESKRNTKIIKVEKPKEPER